MKKIIAFGASTSSTSINQQLAAYAASIINDVNVDILSLKQYENVSIFSEDEEKENGFPEQAVKLYNALATYDGFIVSLAEHNGSYTAAFKNLFDWMSRMGKVWHDKPVLLLGTSPGARGAQTVINTAVERFTWNGASEITDWFSLPLFYENFSAEQGIILADKENELKSKLKHFVSKL